LEQYAEGGKSANQEQLEEECKHCSQMEQVAANAERDSIKYKQVEYMSDKIGKVFDGVVSGVTEWGIYVELNESKCEGMIHIRDLNDDFYIFDEDNYCIKGKRLGRTFQLGEPLKVKVWRANLMKKQLDFALADEVQENRMNQQEIAKNRESGVNRKNRKGGKGGKTHDRKK
jgi:ribonuclease R